MVLDPQIEKSWKTALQSEFRAAYFQELKAFLQAEKSQGPVYPPGKQIFAAFDLCPFDEVKGVIIGQDPYHGPGQAHGLSFSVQEGLALPPSLRNIFKELQSDLKLPFPTQGDLRPWAKQGLLLLNAVLTVGHKSPGSHRGQGWERFTDAVIARLSAERAHLVFFLWGSYARSKAALIDPQKHLILTAPHPSPLSAHRGFFGSRPFSQANTFWESKGIEPLDWQL